MILDKMSTPLLRKLVLHIRQVAQGETLAYKYSMIRSDEERGRRNAFDEVLRLIRVYEKEVEESDDGSHL